MYATVASIFFSLAAVGAGAVIVVSLTDNADDIRQALGLGNAARASAPAYHSRIKRTSRPYRQERPEPEQIRVAA